MKYYKVVRKDDKGEWYSFTVMPHHERLKLHYKLGSRTVPEVGEIFVFSSLSYAVDFGKNEKRVIVTGDAEEIKAVEGCIPLLDDMCVYEDIFFFWKGIWSPLTTISAWPIGRFQVPPVGTYVCKAFTPTEIICDNYEQRSVLNPLTAQIGK
ncbi:MAG: hypothetical protein FJ139_03045 [Deltaproteobacteria bacterium]|nr:hypothetical protein [Deltaproteobacteria bacterium]